VFISVNCRVKGYTRFVGKYVRVKGYTRFVGKYVIKGYTRFVGKYVTGRKRYPIKSFGSLAESI